MPGSLCYPWGDDRKTGKEMKWLFAEKSQDHWFFYFLVTILLRQYL